MLMAMAMALLLQQIAQHAAARKRGIQMQRVHPPHDREVSDRSRPWHGVDAASADPQQLRLARERPRVSTVDHRLALGKPALPSAPSRTSFSKISSPSFAWRALRSILVAAASARVSEPNTPAAPS